MGSEKITKSKPQVKALLLEPLELLGLIRPKGLIVGQFEKVLNGFVDKLAYLDAEALGRLYLVVAANLEGPNENRWPAPTLIYQWARDTQSEPNEEPALVVSWLQSKEGPVAIEGKYIVELRSDLRKYRKPPSEFSFRKLRERAADNQQKLTRIAEAAAVGRA